MTKLRPLLLVPLLILGAACTPAQRDALGTLAAVVAPTDAGPLGGQVAALPTPDPNAAPTATPPSSAFAFPTETPTPRPLAGPLATLTAVAGLLPTRDLSATPYAVELRGRPHFIEFHAWW